jgi:hypothetical protein
MPAPGAKCPDCILAARQAKDRQQLEARTPAAAAPPVTLDPAGLAKSPEVAQARERAVRDLLQFGPSSFDRLMTVMPDADLTPSARESACRSTLTRMTVKKTVKIVEQGWALA